MNPKTTRIECQSGAHAWRLLEWTPPIAVAVVIGLSWATLRDAHAEAPPEPMATATTPAAADASASAVVLPVPGDEVASPARHRQDTRGATLDGRIQLLARELNLSPVQQTQVKKVLLAQREQVAAVWNDTSVPAALRVSRMQSIGDRTADRIRALLNEEQRKKYIQPRQRDAAAGAAGSDVEAWMAAGRRK